MCQRCSLHKGVFCLLEGNVLHLKPSFNQALSLLHLLLWNGLHKSLCNSTRRWRQSSISDCKFLKLLRKHSEGYTQEYALKDILQLKSLICWRLDLLFRQKCCLACAQLGFNPPHPICFDWAPLGETPDLPYIHCSGTNKRSSYLFNYLSSVWNKITHAYQYTVVSFHCLICTHFLT